MNMKTNMKTLKLIGHYVMPQLVSYWGEETNPYADGATCGNGGGYFQPAGGALWSVPNVGDVLVLYEDTSCGDFGDRWIAKIIICATGHEWGFVVDQLRRSDEQEELARWCDAASYGVYRALHGIGGHWLIRLTREAVETAAYRM